MCLLCCVLREHARAQPASLAISSSRAGWWLSPSLAPSALAAVARIGFRLFSKLGLKPLSFTVRSRWIARFGMFKMGLARESEIYMCVCMCMCVRARACVCGESQQKVE